VSSSTNTEKKKKKKNMRVRKHPDARKNLKPQGTIKSPIKTAKNQKN
jgi:hypothetical protein